MPKEAGMPDLHGPDGWRSGQAFNIKVDAARVRKYDLPWRSRINNRLRFSGGSVLTMLGSIFLFPDHWIAGIIILFAGCLSILIIFVLISGNEVDEYADAYLAPGIVIPSDPVRVLVLVPIGFTERVVWGCCVVRLGRGDWELCAGDKVPCCVGFGVTDENYQIYRTFFPKPLIWGTNDKKQLDDCMNTIGEGEWLFLERLIVHADRLAENTPYAVEIKREGVTPASFVKL